jgi:hypothetical protein
MKYWRELQDGDIEYIAGNLRPHDKEEVLVFGLEPLQGLQVSVDLSSKVLTLVEPDGTPACLVGVTSTHKIWLLGTDAIERHPKTFLRHSQTVLDILFTGHPFLWNFVLAKNTVHIKWLQWLGFDIKPEVTWLGTKFYGFHKNNNKED